MHQGIFALIYGVVLLVSVWCGQAVAEADAVNTGRFNDVAISGYDTVAYFKHREPIKGKAEFTVVWRDATWRFSSDKHRQLFAAAPERFAPQYGGWCAYAMSDKGRTVRIDPDAWHIDEGKLYLNYSMSVQRTWLEAKASNIEQADSFYPLSTNVGRF